MAKHVLQELIESSEYADNCRPYSGRGMYGKQCLGITCDSIPKLFANLLQALDCTDAQDGYYEVNANQLDAIMTALPKAQWDSMGLDSIVYFPHIEYTHE